MDINLNIYVGRLAEDVKYYPANGNLDAKITGRLIVNRAPGREKKRSYDTIPISAWGRTAENFAKYTSKGKELAVIGMLQTTAIPPATPGGEWKNLFEVKVNYVSFGNDSEQAEVLKALQFQQLSQGLLESLQEGSSAAPAELSPSQPKPLPRAKPELNKNMAGIASKLRNRQKQNSVAVLKEKPEKL